MATLLLLNIVKKLRNIILVKLKPDLQKVGRFPLRAMIPGRPNNRWIDQLRRDNNNTPPAGSHATVLDDYALTTTTTTL